MAEVQRKGFAVRIVCVNYFYDPDLTTPSALLDRYETLTGWAEGLTAAGAQVTVVQRYAADAEETRQGVRYRFVRDPTPQPGGLRDRARAMHRVVRALRPDVAHCHGLLFARQAWLLKRELACSGRTGRALLVLQDHANSPPTRRLHRWTSRLALHAMDAVCFSAQEQAVPWQEAGLLSAATPVVELMEGSSRFGLQSRAAARARTGLTGDPLCLWVGRLNANKDPITVLNGFKRALPRLPNARLAMVYDEEALLPAVRAWLAEQTAASAQITLLGRRPHAEMELLFNSADMLLLGSHHEGSGYAVLEALACGVVPIVTDIPSFRRLCEGGATGGLWAVGDADALAHTLIAWRAHWSPETPAYLRARFEAQFSFEAIGRQALAVYHRLLCGAAP